MVKNTPITVYTAECIGNASNCLYPNEVKITDEFSAKLAFAKDMVCDPGNKNNYRNTVYLRLPTPCPGTVTMTTPTNRRTGSPRRTLQTSLPMFPMCCTTAAIT